jgi:acetyl-CoA C-acetyltransferase
MRFNKKDVYIFVACRTPFLRNRKKWKDLPVENLGAICLSNLLTKSPYSPDAVIMGCHAGIKENVPGTISSVIPMQNPAKEAWLKVINSQPVSCTHINKVCSSGLQAVKYGYAEIKSGNAELVFAGGMENLLSFSDEMILLILSNPTSLPPYYEKTWDAGKWCAIEACNPPLTKKNLDDYAKRSYNLAALNTISRFANETVEVDGHLTDEEPNYFKDVNEKIDGAFPMDTDSPITGMNASKNAAGAGAVSLLSGESCKLFNIKPLAKIIATSDAPLVSNKEFTIAPVYAVSGCLKKAKLTLENIDVFLVNEAFASVPLYVHQKLGIPLEKINPWGGAIGLGHPIGATGAMLLAMLVHGLIRENKRFGLLTLCNALGEATAIIVENMRLKKK